MAFPTWRYKLNILLIVSFGGSSCIKNIFGWTDDFVLANEEAVKLRNEFRSNMHLPPGNSTLRVGKISLLWLLPLIWFPKIRQFKFLKVNCGYITTSDSAKTARLMREAKERLESNINPDPYIRNYMPTGSLFMRNPPIPLEALYPDGIPEGMSR